MNETSSDQNQPPNQPTPVTPVDRDDTKPTDEQRETKTPLWLRLKVPAWLAVLLVLVTVLIAWFITGPSRSTARNVDEAFANAQQVRITHCLSNSQAEDAARIKARNDLKKHLEELGVKDPEITFASPCPTAIPPGSIGGATTVSSPNPPQGNP